jgi:glucokinase
MRVLAVDLGGSHATCALVDDRSILSRAALEFPDSRKLAPLLSAIGGALRKLAAQDRTPVRGVGFGFCGQVDAARCRVSGTNGKYVDAPDLDLSQWAQNDLGLPLCLENDARLALLGEAYAGAAQGETDVVMFTLGTGIGGVAMMGGELVRGKHGQAGVLGGHVTVNVKGRPCTCGALGCAESEASGWALPLVCASWPGFAISALAAQEINFESLFSCAASHDRIAGEILDHCLRVWGAAAITAIHSFDPEVLIYGGGVLKSADVVIPFLQDYVSRYAWTPWGKVRVRPAQLGNDAALLGVLPLFQQEQRFVR